MIDQQVEASNPGDSPVMSEKLWSKHCTARMIDEVVENLSDEDT